MKLLDVFQDAAAASVDLGKQYLANEIAQNGNSRPAERPDPQDTPERTVAATPGTEDAKANTTKTVLYVVGGVAAVVVVALVLKKK